MFLALFLFVFLESIHFYNLNFGTGSVLEYSLLLLPYFLIEEIGDSALAKVCKLEIGN